MKRFASLEQAGLRLAAMSDKEDGDCSSRESARNNVARFFRSLDAAPGALLRLRQVHGTHIVNARDVQALPEGAAPEADGIISNLRDVALGISVADCTPVLLYDPDAQAVAALHAGREGTLHNIAGAGVRALCAVFNSKPASLCALIGPCAGECCYEVSPEHAQCWQAGGLPRSGRRLDLQGANCLQLENAGLFRHNIHVVPHCTVCGGLFFSYRAGEISNRNLVVVML